jgi:4-amino-4-deoxy-L-arabinose transferase-like glycosyltransferase
MIANKLLAFLDDRYNQVFLLVLILGVALRLKYFAMQSLWNDASVHLWYSLKILMEPSFIFTSNFLGGDYVIPQFITSFFYLFTRDIFISGKLMALTYAIIGIIFIYLLGSEISNKQVGIIAALLFSFNPLFWFYSIRPLADAPLATMFVVVAYCVVKLEKEKNMFWSVATTAAIFFAMLTKQPAIILLVSFFIYAIIRKDLFLKHRALKTCFIQTLGLFVLANIVFYTLFKKIIASLFITKIFNLEGLLQGFEVLRYFPHIFSYLVLVFLVIALFLILFYKQNKYGFILLSTFIFYLYFEFFVRSALDRYILPIIPFAILIAAFGISEVAQLLKLVTKIQYVQVLFIVLTCIFICTAHYNYGTQLIEGRTNSYVGYSEAGEWVKENVPEDAILFAGSWRSMRVFAEREVYHSYPEAKLNSIVNLRSESYRERAPFERDLAIAISKGKSVYIEIDIWEYTQPDWYYPLSQESINYFQNLGFVPVYIVEADMSTPEGIQSTPAIIILKLA